MKRLARTVGGEPLLGDENGFVPLDSADQTLRSIEDALAIAPSGLPDPSDAAATHVSPDTIGFGIPLERAPQLWGIGLNYANHASDLAASRPSAPASFLQPPGVLNGPGGPIRLPPASVIETPTAEAELGLVIGRRCRDVSLEKVSEVVAGYIPVLDITAEEQVKENPRFLTRSKRYDSFFVLGRSIICPDGTERASIDAWNIRTIRNDEIVAENSVGNARFSPDEIVVSLSEGTTLDPGTVIATGTPGAVPIQPGDIVRADIDPLGSVRADVRR